MSIHTFPLDNHLVIFRSTDKHIFILNQTAALIWQAVVDGLQTDEIVEQMANHFNLPPKDIERDIHATFDQWVEQGLNPVLLNTAAETLPPPPIPMVAAVRMALPVDVKVSLKRHFRFGQSLFTLKDYTPDLAVHFDPLLFGLTTVDPKDTENMIELYKDGDNYVICSNQVELERTPLELIAVGRVV